MSRGQVPIADAEPPAWGVAGVLACVLAALTLPVVSGCTPSLNWRLSRLDSHGVVALFPCRPDRRERDLVVGGQKLKVEMQSCEADGGVYAVMSSDVGDLARVRDGLEAWKQAAAANIGSKGATSGAARVKGSTPSDAAARMKFDGRTPEGDPISVEAIFFSQGARIFQASVVARAWNQGAVDTFFEGVAFP